MGMRLYPNTKNVEKLEKLAGVPAGTADRLAALRAKFPLLDDPKTGFFEREDEYGRFYAAMSKDFDVRLYHHFILSGWGKVYSPDHQDENGFGHVDDVESIQIIFDSAGITSDPALTEGVRWM